MMLRLLRGERTLAQTQKALFVVAAFAITMLLSLFGISLYLVQRQIDTNHQTLHEIQQSRLESCLRTNRTLTELIAASVDHKHLTLAQKADLVQYEQLVKPSRCREDVK